MLTNDTKHYSNQLMNYLNSLCNIANLVYVINKMCVTDELRSQNSYIIQREKIFNFRIWILHLLLYKYVYDFWIIKDKGDQFHLYILLQVIMKR